MGNGLSLSAANNAGKLKQNKVMALFWKLDTDGSNSISRDEIRTGMRMLGKTKPEVRCYRNGSTPAGTF